MCQPEEVKMLKKRSNWGPGKKGEPQTQSSQVTVGGMVVVQTELFTTLERNRWLIITCAIACNTQGCGGNDTEQGARQEPMSLVDVTSQEPD
jgi:hypothetical protein